MFTQPVTGRVLLFTPVPSGSGCACCICTELSAVARSRDRKMQTANSKTLPGSALAVNQQHGVNPRWLRGCEGAETGHHANTLVGPAADSHLQASRAFVAGPQGVEDNFRAFSLLGKISANS